MSSASGTGHRPKGVHTEANPERFFLVLRPGTYERLKGSIRPVGSSLAMLALI